MTKQEYFQEVIDRTHLGLLPAMDDESCRYLTEDGKKCVFGICCTNYTPELEDIVIDNMSSQDLARFTLPEGMTLAEMKRCQLAHDTHALVPSHFKEMFLITWKNFSFFEGCVDERW